MAASSDSDFEKIFDQLQQDMQDLANQLADAAVPDTSIVCMTQTRMDVIMAERPTWPISLVHMAVAVSFLTKWRLLGMSFTEVVHLLYLLLSAGDHERWRAHGGSPYFWHTKRQYWERLDGVVPLDALVTMRDQLLIVEGLLRSLPAGVGRDHGALMTAIHDAWERNVAMGEDLDDTLRAAALSCAPMKKGKLKGRGRSSSNLEASHASPDDRIEGGPFGDESLAIFDDRGGEWQIVCAKRLVGMGMRMESLLRGKDLLRHYSEWCDTPFPGSITIAFLDMAFEYDASTTEALRRIPQSERRNTYRCFLHKLRAYSLEDPVLAEACARVRLFYQRTYWANSTGHLVCMAALALAKRG